MRILLATTIFAACGFASAGDRIALKGIRIGDSLEEIESRVGKFYCQTRGDHEVCLPRRPGQERPEPSSFAGQSVQLGATLKSGHVERVIVMGLQKTEYEHVLALLREKHGKTTVEKLGPVGRMAQWVSGDDVLTLLDAYRRDDVTVSLEGYSAQRRRHADNHDRNLDDL